MADRLTKTPKKEGTSSSESSVKRSSSSDIQDRNKSRSPIITRSRSSRNRDDISRTEANSAISRSSKRLKSCSETNNGNNNNNNKTESKNKKTKADSSKSQEPKSQKRTQTRQKSEKNKKSSNNNLLELPSTSSSFSSPPSPSQLPPQQLKASAFKNPEIQVGIVSQSKGSKRKTNSKTTASSTKSSSSNKKKKTNESKVKQPLTNQLVMDQNGSNFSDNLSSSNNQNTNNNNATGSNESSNPINPSTSALLSSYGLAQTDPDADPETDMNRLQSILESRGLHQHILGIPRMQNLFYRSFSSTSTNTKAQQLLNTYNSATNDSEKLHYVLEMCQILLMGNEDTLVGFPIKSVVPTLINLLSMEHNFEIMNHACRALTYMMEALPRSSVVVLDAVPVFLEKLQVIQCMDVAEQSLSALEMLSRRHNKAILHARGVSACLTFLDFFSIDAQRSALTITANCFQNLSIDDFQFVQDSLPILGSHLTIEDKKCIESICLAFYRLVECYQNDCVIISEIASVELLTNIQNVLMNMPPILSTGSFVNVIRMLSIMCVSCSQIAVELLKLNICETLKCLLLSSENLEDKDEMNLVSRSPQEICELTSFIAELMPSLPLSGIFSVDVLFSKANTQSSDVFVWQWKNERGVWEAFNPFDNKIIEQAHLSGEDELELSHVNRTFILDFNSMQKICEDTGNSYPIQRKTNTFNNTELLTRANMQTSDPRSEFFNKEHASIKDFVKFVFKVLNEVYNNSAGYSVRYKCLNGILRIIYYAPKELLKSILANQSISSSIATMLASHDIRVVVCAVQMCNILMEKMPEIFSVYFQREGVIHQIRQLYTDENRFNDKSKDVLNSKQLSNNGLVQIQSASTVLMDHLPMMFSRSSDALSSIMLPSHFNSVPVVRSVNSGQQNNSNKSNPTPTTDQAGRPDENLKRKRTRKNVPFPNTRPPFTLENYPENTSTENDLNICTSLSTTYLNNLPILVSETINSPNLANIASHKGSNRLGSSKDFLQRFNPTRWARWTQSTVNPNTNVIPTTSNVPAAKETASQKPTNTNKDAIKTWIKEQGKTFDEKYFVKSNRNNNEKDGANSSPILGQLNEAINLLKQDAQKGLASIKKLLLDSDLSSFELIHSGLVKNLLSFLISNDENVPEKRENHLRLFLNVFIGAPQSEMSENINEINIERQSFSKLVNKLNACLSQLEQFPLRIQDYSSVTARGSHPLKFFSSNFLKIILTRHPSCTNLKKYKGPMIKLDPFTTVKSVERYLLSKGFGRIKEPDEDSDDDEDLSDEDSLDINFSSSSPTLGKARLQLLIDDHVLPYDVPLFQSIKQYMLGEMENDSEESHLINSKFWSSTFYVFYRLGTESNSTTTVSSTTNSTTASTTTTSSGKSNNASGSRRTKNKTTKKKDELWLEGKVAKSVSPLDSYLKKDLSLNSNINEQTVEVISLLRVLYGINKYWGHLYKFSLIYQPLIPFKEFINNKLTVKANRQLQDPVIIMTATLPNWLQEIAYACPFIFPFETRYLLFYAVCFDRDRALQRLFENTPDLSSSNETRERLFTPRIEKRKKMISRNDLFKNAENLFNDVTNLKALLEIQYENEVGTGLGPTLEFYALISKEFQRAEFEMWRGEVVVNNIKNEKPENSINYVNSNYGLFPVPIGRNTKPSQYAKIKHRFRLLGKFMAKALMDSRMIDINFNLLFYKWLLNEQSTLSIMDLYHLDYTFFSSISQMYKIALKKMKMNGNSNPDLLKLHGSSIEDLNLDFIMPGYPNIELRKGGKDLPVTLNNLENYIELVSHWSLMEGIIKQMEAFKEGFNSIFSLSKLELFYPEELQQLFCGSTFKNWDYKMLMDSCKTDHGFTHESRAIKFLFQILSSYNNEEQRKFLQFLTGFPRLPIGGFKSLNPPFTIVKKNPTESDNPNCLPSVMTCVNYLKLPDYPTIEIMREKLKIAISEGQFSFHLS